jgi:hypothetical protein
MWTIRRPSYGFQKGIFTKESLKQDERQPDEEPVSKDWGSLVRKFATIAGVALVCSAAAAGALARPAISTTAPTSVGIHMFSGLQGNTSATQSDAVSAAKMSDVVYGLAVQIKQFGAAMRQANPNVALYVYVNGELAQSKNCSTYPASWYLYDKSGNKVKSPNGNCAMYPLSKTLWNGYAGWVDYVKHLCAQQLATAPLANGCFVDQISSALNSSWASALPVDPATGSLYTMPTWMNQMGSIGQAIQQFTGKPVIGNSYEGGARYWGMPTNIVNTYTVSGFESEHFLNANSTQWTKQSYWTRNIDMMIDAQAHGKRINVGFTDAPSTTEETWRQFVTASYLLGNNGNAWLAFSSTSKHTYTDPSPLYGLPIGSPVQTASSVAGYAIAPGVYERRFSNGIVVVNVSGASATVSLGATYHTVSGASVSAVTLANGNGAVLAG